MKTWVKKYRAPEYDLSCSESILYAANDKYNLGLDSTTLHIASGFSKGMQTLRTCGVVTAGVACLGLLFTDRCAHQSPMLTDVVIRFQELFLEKWASLDCKKLKEKLGGCNPLIIEGGELLEQVIQEYIEPLQTDISISEEGAYI